jgi:hypothetical protein
MILFGGLGVSTEIGLFMAGNFENCNVSEFDFLLYQTQIMFL